MHIHILGICGTFMGSLAQLARELGHQVTGSDQNVYPPMSTQLEQAGIKLIEGFDPAQLEPAPDLVLVGNAMMRGNPAVKAVLERGLAYMSGPEWLRREVLPGKWVLAVAGTHGKTTTASLLAWILEYAGMSPGFLIGGVHADKTISRFDLQAGSREKIVGEYQGSAFNSPNDLTEAHDGTIYFTDPDFQRSAAPGGQENTNVFRVSAAGNVTVVDDSISNPNGISLSPAQDVLYVAGGGEKGFLRAYPIVDGQPGEGKNLVEDIQVPDGMAIDCLGNIYVTEHTAQRVRVFSPTGDHLATIAVDANITNAAFGGSEGKTLYLTGAGAVWSIDLDVAGFPY